jgi:hypothetical protein
MIRWMQVSVSASAAKFAGKRSSQIFVWTAPSGLARVSTTPPSAGELMRWNVRPIDALTVFVEEGIEIDWLRIVLRVFPWPHLWANWPGKWADGVVAS